MSTFPNPTWADQSPPAWITTLRGALAGLEVPEASAPVVDHDEQRKLEEAAAWLLKHGRDAGKRIAEVVAIGGATDTSARFVLGSGVGNPEIYLSVRSGPPHAKQVVFSYHLTFTAPGGSLTAKVTTRSAAGNSTATWLPWTQSGGSLAVLGAGDLAADFSRLFAEAMAS